MFILAILFWSVIISMFIWIKVEQGHYLSYLHKMCCVHNLTYTWLTHMCYDDLEQVCVHLSFSVNGIKFQMLFLPQFSVDDIEIENNDMCEAPFINVNHEYVLPWLYTLPNFNNFLQTIQTSLWLLLPVAWNILIVKSTFEI